MCSNITCTMDRLDTQAPMGSIFYKDNICIDCSEQVTKHLEETVSWIYVFFERTFGLRGVDGKGKLPDFEVRFDAKEGVWECTSTNKCLWKFKNIHSLTPEVVAHEYMHSVLQGYFRYFHESAAIEESICDIFAIAFKHWFTGNVRDWTVASLRNISRCQVSNRLKKRKGFDHGLIYHNSEVLSHAFYCAVAATNTDSYGLMAQIWFRALRCVGFDETFYGFAKKTIRETVTFATRAALIKSWTHIGVIRAPLYRFLRQKRKNARKPE